MEINLTIYRACLNGKIFIFVLEMSLTFHLSVLNLVQFNKEIVSL